MRTAVFVVAALIVGSSTLAQVRSTKTPTTLDYDHAFLFILKDLDEAEFLEELSSAGVAEDTALNLRAYLKEHANDRNSAAYEDFAVVCKNTGGRFSTPEAMVREIQRWEDENLKFKAGLVREAEKILGVGSLSTVREAAIMNIGLEDAGLMDAVLSGRLTPEMIIARSCELAKGYTPPDPPAGASPSSSKSGMSPSRH